MTSPTIPLTPSPATKLNASCEEALLLLSGARAAALAFGRDAWEFAVEIRRLRAAGLTETDLRVLLCGGLAEHGAEQFRPDSAGRAFLPLSNLTLPESSCFVLTPLGEQTLRALPVRPLAPLVPCWDERRRRLSWCEDLVKQFRQPATAQETILTAFQEEGWPPRIDDPLPGVPDIDPRCRLQDAIKRLNRNQIKRLLCFHGDGSGCGIAWAPLHTP